MNFRINHQFVALAILFSTSSLMGDDTKPAAPATPAAAIPDIAPFLLPSVEEKFTSDAAKADAATAKAEQEAAKAKRSAAEIRLKAYKDKLAEITKTGDFDKAQQIKARITQLENDPDGESHKPEKPTKRPRPKDTVKFGGHTYALIKEPATWHVAKLRCEEMGGHLVCIASPQEEAFVAKLAGKTNVWIGASNELSDTDWKWLNGANLSRANWSFNDSVQDPTKAYAMTFWGVAQQFDDYPIGGRLAYICRWD
jgi:hypothetical protein